MYERPVWAKIDLEAIRHNVTQVKSLLKDGTKLCAVIKADGYGHGARQVARAALSAGADYFAVAILNEALELRQEGFDVPILVLGYSTPEQAVQIVDKDITQTIFSYEAAQALSQAGVAVGRKAKVHIKIDTGMSRIGIRPEDAGSLVQTVAQLPGIEVEGVFSHFATADCKDKTFALQQFDKFNSALKLIEQCGVKIPIKHIANSAAVLEMPKTHLDMVRPGIILYGLWPSPEVERKINLKPAMQFKAKISFVKEVPQNISVSYGQSYFTTKPSVIATVPVGYADGWTRRLSGKVSVLVRGRPAPVIGRICMDQFMIDVTDIPNVKTGDEVVLFGGDLTVDEIAEKLGTINYEVVCMVGKRVPRRYISETKDTVWQH